MRRERTRFLPTRQGYTFLLILTALLVGSANYNNNLGFILTFLLGAMLIVSLFHSCKNLTGLRVTSVRVKPVFANESAVFQLRVRAETLPRFALEFNFDAGDGVRHDFITRSDLRVDVPIMAGQRGTFNPGPLTVSTRYPFGLVRCRFKLNVDVECLVYPKPLHRASHWANGDDRYNDGAHPAGDGVDDFEGFKAYQPGDPLKHIAWKAFARGQGLLVKEFSGHAASAVLIDWYAVPEDDVEKKLSLMCGMLLKADQLELEYGLRLPGQVIEADRSERHKHDCLRALALFGSPRESQQEPRRKTQQDSMQDSMQDSLRDSRRIPDGPMRD